MSIVDRLTEFYKLCKRSELCKLTPYICPAGVWTCGWGSTGPDVFPGVPWTQEYADRRLDNDAIKFACGVLTASPVLGKASDKKLSALTDFAYNCGIARYKGSTLRKRVDASNWKAAAKELGKWTHGGGRVLPGLVIRRAAEAALLLEE